MSNHKLRADKECENCGYTVDIAYCSNCGQKNVETRQSFWHLITHFAEDFTHYDSAFWKTIKYLLFRPAKLTIAYLQGYRQKYVAPVKLYIFISFVTFFLPNLYPEFSSDREKENEPAYTLQVIQDTIPPKDKMYTKQSVWLTNINTDKEGIQNPVTYSSIKEMDSIENIKPDSLKLSKLEYKLAKKLLKLYKHNTPQQVEEKLLESINHNLPKALFIYMPFFAFFIWLFHSKKRWYFFDHGIFTLHYFSFLLLVSLLITTIAHFVTAIENDYLNLAVGILVFFTVGWTIYYFYRSHRKMYHEIWIINFIKCTLMFVINIVSIISLLVFFMLISYYTLH